MDELLKILNEIEPDVDFIKEKNLVDDGILDSLTIVMLVSDIEDVFDVEITPVDIIPENFQSADAIYTLIQSLQDKG